MGSSHGAEGARAGEKGPGTLILAGVPIGRSEDASARLAAELARADVVAAEDTRRVRRLAAELNVQISGRVVAYYDVIEARRAEELVKELEDGKDVLVVTDAGMPGVSDPGYRVVTAAAQAGMRVTAIPGPSALTTALAVSGLPTDRFCFEGFPPRKPGERQARFTELAADPRTQVFFESPRRVHATLRELSASHGPDRAAVVCRELTKVHEEIRRGTLAGLTEWADPEGPAQRGGGSGGARVGGGGGSSGGVRGEITLVVAGIGTAAAKAAARDVAREARRAARFAARGARETSRDSATGHGATGDTATGDTATGDTVSLDR
ncbi:MAG TPA: 16S rRNA (cytidine(1402)-2'-O)-methyltransferase [Trebonia sp.]|nr:16S rRNA (cytidine(1402)-2'-O)-methyltransferase [Trebonia sp.]